MGEAAYERYRRYFSLAAGGEALVAFSRRRSPDDRARHGGEPLVAALGDLAGGGRFGQLEVVDEDDELGSGYGF